VLLAFDTDEVPTTGPSGTRMLDPGVGIRFTAFIIGGVSSVAWANLAMDVQIGVFETVSLYTGIAKS